MGRFSDFQPNELMINQIRYFFEPRNIAVIGASRDVESIGQIVVSNLVSGFQGGIFPINPKATEILGLQCYPSVKQVTEEIDLSIICVPPKVVPLVIRESGEKSVKASIIITAGFGEMGHEGHQLQEEIIQIAKQFNMRVLGPNCLGTMRTANKLNASFAGSFPNKGPIAFVSQSGAMCTAILDYSFEEGIGFSNFVSIGNKADIDDADLISYFADDPETKSVGIYMESIPNGRKFMDSILQSIKKIPVVAIKSGRSMAGAVAAASHTGALAGSDKAFDTAFTQIGIQRTYSISEFFAKLRALAYQPPARGNRIAIITNAGGPGVMTADEVEIAGLELAHLSKKTIETLDKVLPASWPRRNPIDIIGDAKTDRYYSALSACIEDSNIDGIIIVLSPQAMTEPLETAKAVVELAETTDKPITAAWIGGKAIREGEDYLDTHRIPEVLFPSLAVQAMAAVVERGNILRRFGEKF
ncbi:MAG: acetate--CoA ligase family protein [Promethearchaeota archaeon]